jgi:hypothetical protein
MTTGRKMRAAGVDVAVGVAVAVGVGVTVGVADAVGVTVGVRVAGAVYGKRATRWRPLSAVQTWPESETIP